MKKDRFWTDIMPVCLADNKECQKLADLLRSKGLHKNFYQFVKSLDENEFNIFLAHVVIKASGKGVVGVDLTEKIGFLKQIRFE